MEISELKFRRRFSVNPFKTLRMPLGRMDCYKDWVNDTRGDPYPVTFSDMTESQKLTEHLTDNRWHVTNESAKPLALARLLGGFTPCATFDVEIDKLTPDGKSKAGIRIDCEKETRGAAAVIALSVADGMANVCVETSGKDGTIASETFPTEYRFVEGMHLIVSIHGPGHFDEGAAQANIYASIGDSIFFLASSKLAGLSGLNKYSVFINTTVSAYVSLQPGASFAGTAECYMDAGASQADMKSVRYENGLPMIENGRMFLTMSVREELGGYQSILSWRPGTSDYQLIGCLFFDYGDDLWNGDVASSIVFDRRTKMWYIWACAFSHGHILCRAATPNDPRYGVNVLDARLMPRETLPDGSFLEKDGKAAVSNDETFFAKSGDEDPDLMFDESIGKWRLILDRLVTEDGGTKYRYFMFTSDDPMDGFTFGQKTTSGDATGGSIITVEGKRYLLCGSDFNLRARYRVHPIEDITKHELLKFDYDDGGFRGWGTLLPVPCGTRTRYYFMTFDRHNCSKRNNWSYGNLYLFEADRMTRRDTEQ